MAQPLGLAPTMRDQLLRWRWPIVALAAALFIGFEVSEHDSTAMMLANPDFVREVALFGIIGPLLAGIALTLLAVTTTERTKATRRLERERGLSQQLANARDWEELTELVARFPSTSMPVVGASLLVPDQNQNRLELAAEWWDPDSRISPGSTLPFHLGDFQTCVAAHSPATGTLFRCTCLDNAQVSDLHNSYCLPLVHAGLPVGLLHLLFPLGAVPSAGQTDCLNHMASAMAIAIDGARPQHAPVLEAEAVHAERQRIARDLHDTLGQSLGYLHLKLDQLTGDAALQDIVEIRRELERMRTVANESYEQVRGTVAALHLPTSAELADTLLKQARSVGDRAGFEVELFLEGQPRPLAPDVQRQILYLCREALNNVEKHAHAQRVDTYLLWGEDTLFISVSDDGQGFDPNHVPTDGHYGLQIMRERAEEFNGEVIVTSSPGVGTEITLLVPIVAHLSGSNEGG